MTATEATETHGELAALEKEWDRLALELGVSPFLRPGWISAWWDAFGSGRLEIIATRREGRLAGVLPVVRRHGAILSPTNWHSPGFGAVAEDDAAIATLYEAALAGRPRCLDASFLAAESADARWLLQSAGSARPGTRVVIESPYVAVDRDWDSYWSSLSKNLRGTVRRCRNRLADRGEVTIEIRDGSDGLDALLEEGFGLEASGWKGAQGSAIVSRPETRRFYESVCRWAAAEGILRLAFLRVDRTAVAFNLSLEAEGRHYLLKPGHDAALDSLGPGTVLTAEMVERCFSLGLDAYEFLGAADRYKLRWTDTCHQLVRVQVFAPGALGALTRFVQTRGRRAAKWLVARRRGRA